VMSFAPGVMSFSVACLALEPWAVMVLVVSESMMADWDECGSRRLVFSPALKPAAAPPSPPGVELAGGSVGGIATGGVGAGPLVEVTTA